MGKSYGFIEIPSTSAAITAIDIMLKTADVEFVTWEKKLGGRLVTVVIQGTVSAVTEAVETAAARSIKEIAAKAVIANPHEEIIKMVRLSAERLQAGGREDGSREEDGREEDGSQGGS